MVFAAAVLVACGTGDTGVEAQSSGPADTESQQSSIPTTSIPSDAEQEATPTTGDRPSSGPGSDQPPYGPGVAVGETYEYTVFTHCGIEWAEIDGALWKTDQRLSGGNQNPPKGWGDPEQDGQLRIEDADSAIFVGDNGESVTFQRTGATEVPYACD